MRVSNTGNAAKAKRTPARSRMSALMRALRDENLGALRGALARGEDPNAREGDLFPLARATAIESNSADFIEALLAAGTDPKQADSNGSTALHAAAVHQNTEAVERLARARADLDAVDINGDTALLLACRRAQPGESRAQTAFALIDAGADVNRAGADGLAPVHVAAHRNAGALLRRLVEAGADLTARDRRGRGVDFWALDAVAGSRTAPSEHPSPEALRELCRTAAWLLTHANVSEAQSGAVRGPALCRAAHLGWFEACAVLLDAGATPETPAQCLDLPSQGRPPCFVERSARELAFSDARRAFALFDAENESMALLEAMGNAPAHRRSLADLAGLPSVNAGR